MRFFCYLQPEGPSINDTLRGQVFPSPQRQRRPSTSHSPRTRAGYMMSPIPSQELLTPSSFKGRSEMKRSFLKGTARRALARKLTTTINAYDD
jgi:hypothetical protein